MTKQERRILELKKGKGKDINSMKQKKALIYIFLGEEKKTLIECEYNFFF